MLDELKANIADARAKQGLPGRTGLTTPLGADMLSSRIYAMPPNQKCPACTRMVPDWHREWHSLEDQKNIFDGKAAMECPFCKGNIAYDRFLLLAVAESRRALAKRDILKAAEWARNCDGKTLREYLHTPPGAPYGDSWTDVEIQAADSRVAAKLE